MNDPLEQNFAVVTDVTVMHPVGAAALMAAVVAMTLVRRAFVPVVLLALAVFVSSAQRIAIVGADFNFLRAAAVLGLVIAYVRGDLRWIRLGWIDLLIIIQIIATIVSRTVLWGDFRVMAGAVGSGLELLSLYFVIRASIRSLEDVRLAARGLGVIALLVAPLFLLELSTGRNLFSVFGGVREYTVIREGKLRCQGAFSHPILAGCFFALMAPMWIASLYRESGGRRLLAAASLVAASLIVVACASSTPVALFIAAPLLWLLYPMRFWMRYAWIAAILLLCFLHMVMKKPVWHLVARIDLVGGSTGYHRFHLIDRCIANFSEWWLVGAKSTGHWGLGLEDVTNQFVLEGVRGGVVALVALVLQFVFALAAIGELLRQSWQRSRTGRIDPKAASVEEATIFGFGVMIVAAMLMFLAVSYFGQTVLIWALVIGAAGSIRQIAVMGRLATRGESAMRLPAARRVGRTTAPAS